MTGIVPDSVAATYLTIDRRHDVVSINETPVDGMDKSAFATLVKSCTESLVIVLRSGEESGPPEPAAEGDLRVKSLIVQLVNNPPNVD